MAFNCTEIMYKGGLIQFLNKSDGSGSCSNMTMKSGSGIRINTKYKYFRLCITAASGSEGTIQFTKLKFATSSGRTFSYWNGIEQKTTIKNFVKSSINKGIIGAKGGEAAEYGLLTDPKEGKCCITKAYPSSTSPLIITYELLNKTIDLSIYDNWYWYTANDTASNTGRNITKFKLQVSNTAADNDWITVDENTDPNKIKTTANWSLAYEGKIKI